MTSTSRPDYTGPERRNQRRTSIKTKLTRLFLLMGIVPSLMIMVIMYFGFSKNMEKQIGDHLENLAMETSLRVDMYLKNKIDNVLKYSSYSTLKRSFFPGSKEEHTSRFIRSLFKFDPDLYNITLIPEIGGKPTFSYRPFSWETHHLKELLSPENKLKRGEVLLTPVQYQPNQWKLHLLTPLFSEINEKPLGFLLATFDLDSLFSLIRSIPVTGSHYLAMLNQNHQVLATTFKSKGKPLEGESLSFLEPHISGNTGWFLTNDPNQKASSILSFRQVKITKTQGLPSSSWYILVSQNKDEAFSPILWLFIKLFGMSALLIIFILSIAIFKIEAIWKPILSLKKGVETIGSGNFNMELLITTGDEIEDLAHSFNKMGKNLKQSHERLEAQNRKLKQLNDVKNNFISMVSHELRTPLMIIKEALSQVLGGLKGPVPEDQKTFLEMAHRNTGRLNKIIEDLLNISKIETGKIKFNRENHDLVAVLENEVINQKIKSDEKQITVLRKDSFETYRAYFDKEKIQIIFANLLGNAIKFTHKESQIFIEISDHGEDLKVTVQDTGPGFPPEMASKIFDRFVRLSSTPLVGAPSTGLGLAIAKELIDMHQGKIWAESDGKNGATFCFTLPQRQGRPHLETFLEDRINEAIDRGLGLSLIMVKFESLQGNQAHLDAAFEEVHHRCCNNPFDIIEIIDLPEEGALFIFSFNSEDKAPVFYDKFSSLVFASLTKISLDNDILPFISLGNYGVHGKTNLTLLNYLETSLSLFEPLLNQSTSLKSLISHYIKDEKVNQESFSFSSHSLKKLIDQEILSFNEAKSILKSLSTLPLCDCKNIPSKEILATVKLSQEEIREYEILPLSLQEEELTVAMVNPFHLPTIHFLESKGFFQLDRQYLMGDDFERAFNQLFLS